VDDGESDPDAEGDILCIPEADAKDCPDVPCEWFDIEVELLLYGKGGRFLDKRGMANFEDGDACGLDGNVDDSDNSFTFRVVPVDDTGLGFAVDGHVDADLDADLETDLDMDDELAETFAIGVVF